jgi:hypothetical protein
MANDWQELTRLTGDTRITVERVRLDESEIAIEGSFELPPLARLPVDDQVFIMAFVRSHGSIKEMQRTFGISYPTVKNRLNRISESFELVEVESTPTKTGVLTQLEHGEITFEEALGRLSE